VFLIASDGWAGAARPRPTIVDKDRRLAETPDLTIGSGRGTTRVKCDLIPPGLVVARFFAGEQAKVDELDSSAEESGRAVEEYVEEYVEEQAAEDGPLADAGDDGSLTKAQASARLKQAEREGADPDEVDALRRLLKLYDAETAARKAAKEAQADLDRATLNRYGDLTEAEIKTLVLDDKWHATIVDRVAGEVTALTLDLVARIRELGQRYAETVADLDAELDRLENRVAGHLADMGVK
jgi:type I restriction enzyme M protein